MVSDLNYNDLVTLASGGGLSTVTRLSDLTAAFLLSACWTLRNRYLWQEQILPIDDTEYNNIIAMIEQAESELMGNLIGSIIPSVAIMLDPVYIPMIGQLIPQANYPELTAAVPPGWLVGSDIQLPDMLAKGVFGAVDVPTIGIEFGDTLQTLTEGQMPSHTHIQDPHTHSYTLTNGVPTAAGLEPTFADLTTQVPAVTGATTATNQTAGNDEAFINLPESLLVVWYIIGQ